MRIVAFGDWHICHTWPMLKPEDFVNTAARLAEYVRGHRPEVLLFLGDRFRAREPRDSVRSTADICFRRLANAQAEHKGVLGILVGNHDRYSESVGTGDTYSALRTFCDAIPNVVLMDEAKTYFLHSDLAVHALPTGRAFDPSCYDLKKAKGRRHVLAYHGLISGAAFDKMGKVRSKGGLTSEELDSPHWDAVLCGDVHIPQVLKLKHTVGVYVGSTLRLTEADAAETLLSEDSALRGWVDVDLGKKKPTFTFVDGGSPQMQKLELDPSLKSWPDPAGFKGSVVYATLSGTVAELRKVPDSAVKKHFVDSRVQVHRKPARETSTLVKGISATTSPLEDVVAYTKTANSGFDLGRLRDKAKVAFDASKEEKGLF